MSRTPKARRECSKWLFAAMTPEEIAREWTNVNQVMELVKQEGDANCERAFDFLLSALAASEQRGKAIIEDRRKVVDLLNKAAAKLQASEQRVRELEDKLTLSANEDAAWTKRALASERETARLREALERVQELHGLWKNVIADGRPHHFGLGLCTRELGAALAPEVGG